MTQQHLANRSFMGESQSQKIKDSRVTIVGGGIDIESTILSLIGLGVKHIQHFDNTTSRKEPSILAPFAQPKRRHNWRLEETINNWFTDIEYTAIAAPPIRYLIDEHNPSLILTNSQQSFERPTIYVKASNSLITVSEKPIYNHPISYDIHTKLISGSLLADEFRKRVIRYNQHEEFIRSQQTIQLTNHFFEKAHHSSVLIVGVGGIGTYTALSQVLSETKNITLIDPDVIEDTNLNRQLFYAKRIGESKSAVLSQRLKKLKPHVHIHSSKSTFSEFISQDKHKYDVLFCCTDNYESRVEVAQYCEKSNTRLLEAGCTPTTAIVSEYVPNITRTITEKRQLKESLEFEKQRQQKQTSCVYANPSIITPNLISGVLQSYFSHFFIDSQNKYQRLQKNFCFNSHLATKFYEE